MVNAWDWDIYLLIDPIKINYSWIGKYTIVPWSILVNIMKEVLQTLEAADSVFLCRIRKDGYTLPETNIAPEN